MANNNLCPPYPGCLEGYEIGSQTPENCSACIEGEDIELLGGCYNIETTTSLNLYAQYIGGDIPSDIGQLDRKSVV